MGLSHSPSSKIKRLKSLIKDGETRRRRGPPNGRSWSWSESGGGGGPEIEIDDARGSGGEESEI